MAVIWRFLLTVFCIALLSQGAAAQSDSTAAEAAGEARGDTSAADPYSQWQRATSLRQRAQPGDLEQSLALFQKSLEGYRAQEGENGGSVPVVMRDVAITQQALGQAAAAIATYAQRVDLLRQTKPGSTDLASALDDLGRAQQAAGDNESAIQQFQTEVETYRAAGAGADAAVASATVEEGISWYNLKQFDKALAAYQQGESLYRAAGTDPVGLAVTLSNIAGLQTELGRHAEAQAARAEQVALLAKADPAGLTYAAALIGLGTANHALSRDEEAMAVFEQARRIFAERTGDTTRDLADVLVNEGVSQESLGRTEVAIERYRQAVARYEAALGPQSEAVADTLYNIARASNFLTHFADAEAAANRAVIIYRIVAPNSDKLAYAVQELAFSDQSLSKYQDSLPLIRETRAIWLANHGDMSSQVADSYLNEGISVESLKDYPGALNIYNEAIRRYDAVYGKGNINTAYAINNIAWVYKRMQDYPLSETYFRRALPIVEKEIGPTAANTTKVYINIGIVSELQGKYDDAIRWTMKGLANLRLRPTMTLEDQRWAYDTLSKAFKGRDDPKRAILFAKLAINAQQKIRANNKAFKPEDLKEFRDEWRFLYQDLADMLITEGRLSEAQATLNMEKEEELIDFVQRDASADLRDSSAPLTPKEDAVVGNMDTLLSQPIAAAKAVETLIEKKNAGGLSTSEEADLARLQGSLDTAYSGFMDDVDVFLKTSEAEDVGVQKEVEAINLDYTADTQEQLRAFHGKAAMLQIAALGDATHIFLTMPDAAIHREVKISRAELSHLVFDALDAIERRDPAVNGRMQALYRVLVEPVAPDLKASGAETVMLNLQGFLRYVPFAALYDGKHYLIEDYALSLYTPAAKTEFTAADRDPAKSAGFGVTAGHPGFAPLPGVAHELEAIFGDPGKPGALAGGTAIDASFTRDTFRAALRKRPEIVHIASHFKLVPGRETDSFLLLGDGSPLSLSDIRKGRGFRFGGVDLLTLSACETARGGDGDGDEVESFGALAQMNGASSVMATLWPVADEATATLMQSFYRHMVEDKMSKADALRAAQIEAIRGTGADTEKDARGAASLLETSAKPVNASHPYFWSPFVLMGNWM